MIHQPKKLKLRKTIPMGSILLLIVISMSLSVAGQQTASFPEYNFNPFIINSAYAGLLPTTEVTIAHTGFSDFEGSPENFNLSFHSPLNDGKVGLGAGFVRDQIGVTTSTQAFAAYSYKIFFDFEDNRPYWQIYQPGVLSFGITVGINQFQDNLLELGITDDPNFQENINATVPTIGVGFLFNHARFFAGASAPNILGDRLANVENELNLSNPVYGYFGYRFYTSMFENLMIKPNVLLKYEDGAPFQVDVNLSASFQNRFEIGAGYRTTSSINLLAGVYLINNFRLIYNYNIADRTNPLGNTHGLVLSYRFGQGYGS